MRETRRAVRKRKERLGNRMALVGITFVVISLAVVVNFRGAEIKEKDLAYQIREENLSRQLEEEKERAQKLEEERIYVQIYRESCNRKTGPGKSR